MVQINFSKDELEILHTILEQTYQKTKVLYYKLEDDHDIPEDIKEKLLDALITLGTKLIEIKSRIEYKQMDISSSTLFDNRIGTS